MQINVLYEYPNVIINKNYPIVGKKNKFQTIFRQRIQIL